MFNFTVLLKDFNVFEAMEIMFFNKRNDLIGTQMDPLFSYGMCDENRAINFSFSDEE